MDNIKSLYGAVGSELLPVEKIDDQLHFKVKGYVSNANYNMKKMTMLLFINRKLWIVYKVCLICLISFIFVNRSICGKQ